VTGADGQLGYQVVRLLLSKNYEVRGTILAEPHLNRRKRLEHVFNSLSKKLKGGGPILPQSSRGRRLKELDIDLITGNLMDPKFATYAVQGVDAVIHTANLISDYAFENNVMATFNVVKACADRADKVYRLVYVSSSSVYPNDPEVIACEYHPVDETHPLRPIGAYSMSKLIGEQTVWALGRDTDLSVSIIRPSSIVSGDSVLSRWSVDFVCSIMRKGAKYPQGGLYAQVAHEPWKELRGRATSGDQPCSVTDEGGSPWVNQLVDVRDVAGGILCALESNGAKGEAFNISAPQPIEYPEAATILGELTGTDPLEYCAPVRWVYDLDSTKAKNLIGYSPKWGCRDMIEDALACQKGEK
jgi:nucleoside-diphosphate-sugar epimerase